MADLNIMSLYTDAYLADTTHLSTEQHGAYLLILVAMWRAGGKLPSDPMFLQRVTKVQPRRWAKVWSEIGIFFLTDNSGERGLITQKRLCSEYGKALRRKEVYSANGRRGGRPAADPSNRSNPLKSNDAVKATGFDPVKQNETKHEPDQKLNETERFDSGYPPSKLSLLLTPYSLDSAVNSESESEKPKAAARPLLDKLEVKCREAADLRDDPSPSLLILQPIIALLDLGYDLDTDVLPILRKSAKAGRKGRSWGYYVEAIKESRDKARAAAANGAGEHRSLPDEVRWRSMWDWWKKTKEWPIVWGAGPDIPGCDIPKELIERWSAEQTT
jgi:uncharacterized protein YdaU (DUF1376 family)